MAMLSTKSKKIIAAYLLLNSLRRRSLYQAIEYKNDTINTYGEYADIFKKLQPHEYFKYIHMTKEQFDLLYSKLKCKLIKQRSNAPVNEAIPAEVRLVITLRTLATGNTFSSIGNAFCIKTTTVARIVRAVCKIIKQILLPEYIPKPTIETWREISDNFYVILQFPNCIGALGRCESPYLKYNLSHPLHLTALVDVYCKYTLIDVENGENNPDKIFSNTFFKQCRPEEIIPYRKLPGTREELPLVMVGNEEFPLRFYIMRRFLNRNLTVEQQVFNDKVISVENLASIAFNVTHQLWGIMLKIMKYSKEFSTLATIVCCILHNFLLTTDTFENINTQLKILSEYGEIQELPLLPKIPCATKSSKEGVIVRDKLTSWFLIEESQI